MPLVAFVELPPQKDDLSRSTTRPPNSSTVLAADMPARPPPTTMAWSHGNTVAMAFYLIISELNQLQGVAQQLWEKATTSLAC
mmetsp:Transcript_40497/g.95215  ORF Transcript_40497/g.95215 Transcript_40497/m.95215 type:complete len:83 (-) Transcript_40497:66-314(-)